MTGISITKHCLGGRVRGGKEKRKLNALAPWGIMQKHGQD